MLINLSQIRATYSSLIIFASGITSLITGALFMIILTRTLSTEEFGTWNLILSLFVYGLILEPAISYWVTRDTARDIRTDKTSFLASGIFSIPGIIIYLTIAYFISIESNADYEILVWAISIIPLMFLNKILLAIGLGSKPHINGFVAIINEVIKVLVVLVLVYYYEKSVIGIILSYFVALTISNAILFYFVSHKIKNKIKMEYLTKWIKFSWLALYPRISVYIYAADVLVFASLTQSVDGLAFYGAAAVIGSIVGYSALIGSGIYPKLLSGGKKNLINGNVTLLFYFAFPMAALSITFAEEGLLILNPVYEIVSAVVIFITIRIFLDALNMSLYQHIIGIEKVDINPNSTFIDYIKSNLFIAPTFQLINSSTYLIILVIGILILQSYKESEINLILFWSFISIVGFLPYTVYLFIKIKREIKINIEYKIISKYFVICSIVFSIIFFLSNKYLIYNESIINFSIHLTGFIIASIGGYFLLTYALDSRTREIFNSILNELKR